MNTSLKLNRNSKLMLGLVALLSIWSWNVGQQTKARKAKAAAARAAATPVAAAGTVAPAPNSPVTAASLASLKLAPWGQDPYFKTEHLLPAPGGDQVQASRRQQPLRPSGSGLVLRGILWAGEHSSAQICDRVAQVGETVQGWKIVQIRQNSVTLVNRRATVTLQLHEGQS